MFNKIGRMLSKLIYLQYTLKKAMKIIDSSTLFFSVYDLVMIGMGVPREGQFVLTPGIS